MQKLVKMNCLNRQWLEEGVTRPTLLTIRDYFEKYVNCFARFATIGFATIRFGYICTIYKT